MTYRLLLVVGACFAFEGAEASSVSYDCEVKQILKLSDVGTLEDATGDSAKASLYKSLVGKTFVVNRSTGRVQGDKWFSTMGSEKVTVISDGRQQNAFRAVYVGGPPTSVTMFLYIRETEKSERARFILLDSSFAELTFSGTCK